MFSLALYWRGTLVVTSEDMSVSWSGFKAGFLTYPLSVIRARNLSNLGPKNFLFLSGNIISLGNKWWLWLWLQLFSKVITSNRGMGYLQFCGGKVSFHNACYCNQCALGQNPSLKVTLSLCGCCVQKFKTNHQRAFPLRRNLAHW